MLVILSSYTILPSVDRRTWCLQLSWKVWATALVALPSKCVPGKLCNHNINRNMSPHISGPWDGSSCESGKMNFKPKIILFRIYGFRNGSISSLYNYMFACCSFSAWSVTQIISGFLSKQFRMRELCGWGNGVGTHLLTSESKTGIPSITSKTVWQVTCSEPQWFGFVETLLFWDWCYSTWWLGLTLDSRVKQMFLGKSMSWKAWG